MSEINCETCKYCELSISQNPCCDCDRFFRNFVRKVEKPVAQPKEDLAEKSVDEALGMAYPEGYDRPKVDHYNRHPSGVECIDVIQWMPYNVGAAMKYLWRCDEKHETAERDLKKAKDFINFELKKRGFK